MAYPETDVVILCFSVVRPDSLESITSKWMPELNKLTPTAQIVLVGTQIDLRDNVSSNTNNQNILGNKSDDSVGTSRARYISTEDGEEARQRIKAFKYVECSALKQINVNDVFNTCIESYISFNEKVEPPCSCFQSIFKRFRFTDWLRRFTSRRRNSSNKASKVNQEKYSFKHES
jgi:GTPase SAR1 family protein